MPLPHQYPADRRVGAAVVRALERLHALPAGEVPGLAGTKRGAGAGPGVGQQKRSPEGVMAQGGKGREGALSAVGSLSSTALCSSAPLPALGIEAHFSAFFQIKSSNARCAPLVALCMLCYMRYSLHAVLCSAHLDVPPKIRREQVLARGHEAAHAVPVAPLHVLHGRRKGGAGAGGTAFNTPTRRSASCLPWRSSSGPQGGAATAGQGAAPLQLPDPSCCPPGEHQRSR